MQWHSTLLFFYSFCSFFFFDVDSYLHSLPWILSFPSVIWYNSIQIWHLETRKKLSRTQCRTQRILSNGGVSSWRSSPDCVPRFGLLNNVLISFERQISLIRRCCYCLRSWYLMRLLTQLASCHQNHNFIQLSICMTFGTFEVTEK